MNETVKQLPDAEEEGREPQRRDPFAEDELVSLIQNFTPKPKRPSTGPRLSEREVADIAEAQGFPDRGPTEKPAPKEPLKALQFKLPVSVIEAFHADAFAACGTKHGAKTEFFLKIWKAYEASET